MKAEKKKRKSSLSDAQKVELKAMVRGLRNGLKAGVPCAVVIGRGAIQATKE